MSEPAFGGSPCQIGANPDDSLGTRLPTSRRQLHLSANESGSARLGSTSPAVALRKAMDDSLETPIRNLSESDLVVDRAAGDRIQSAPRFVPREGRLAEVPVNRTDAIGFMGGAQNTNEECYLFQKAARLLGLAYVEHQARL